MNIVTCFQDVVGEFYLDFSPEENLAFAQKAIQVREAYPMKAVWFCNTYTSLGSEYELFNDPLFSRLVGECKKAVEQFSKHFDVDYPLTCREGWLNVANPGEFQEYHDHPGCHFSAVYYIHAVPHSGNIVFKSHAAFSNMFNLPKHDTKPLNFAHCYFDPQPSKLLVFRSNLQHMVLLNKSTEPRIGASFNYVVDTNGPKTS